MSKLAVGVLMLCAASQAVGGQVAYGQNHCRLVQTDSGWGCADSSPGSEPDSDGGSGGGSSGCTWTAYRPTLVEADNNRGFYDDPGFDGTAE